MSKSEGWLFLRNVLIRVVGLFIFLNIFFALTYPLDTLGSISAYNWLFPGRERFPHGDVPDKSFNITTSNIKAMFQSHAISDSNPDEFRVVILGDSSVWGFLLEPGQTVTAKLNLMALSNANGRKVRFYNLGYPTLSLTKDLLLFENAMRFEPDMIFWFITLEAMPKDLQLESPLLELNPSAVKRMLEEYDLDLAEQSEGLKSTSIWERTIVGSRVQLSELIRLQLYGFSWAATGVDHYIPESYNERMENLSADLEYKDFTPGELTEDDLHFEAFRAGLKLAEGIPIVLINEPIFTSSGENSEIRYNFFYPRWAYDEYRGSLLEQAAEEDWLVLDLWDAVPAEDFTDSAIHYSPAGSELVATKIAAFLETQFDFFFSE